MSWNRKKRPHPSFPSKLFAAHTPEIARVVEHLSDPLLYQQVLRPLWQVASAIWSSRFCLLILPVDR